jgi:hypothetical protein
MEKRRFGQIHRARKTRSNDAGHGGTTAKLILSLAPETPHRTAQRSERHGKTTGLTSGKIPAGATRHIANRATEKTRGGFFRAPRPRGLHKSRCNRILTRRFHPSKPKTGEIAVSGKFTAQVRPL